jgi:hypothetical protein
MARHDCTGQQRLRCNGQRDSGAITMCGITIAMDAGGGDGHDCNGRQWWQRNGQWDNGAIVMASAMNSGGGNRRQQWRWHRNGQWWLWRNGRRDSGAIVMCGIAIAMDGGGGDGQSRRDGSAMGDCNGARTIMMGDSGSGAMDGGMMVRL